MNKKPIAVIILNWNGVEMLREFLPKVLASTDLSIADVIVADNGSVDDSLSCLSSQFPEVGVIDLGKNYGYAEGYNRAIATTCYLYTVLLNSDVATAEGWLPPLYRHMEDHPEVGACQPKILSYDNPGQFEYAGACGGFIDKNGFPYCRGRLFSTIENDNGQYDDIRPIFWASGAALMVRSSLYTQVGGLDRDFFAHMEEIDLCWRIHLNGYHINVVPQSKVYHLGGGTLSATNPRKTYLNFRNNLLLLHKNLPDHSRSRRLFIRRIYDTIAWFKFTLSFDFANANAIIKAHCDFRKMSKAYTSHPDRDLLLELQECRRNIIVEYYLMCRRTFNRLSEL